METSTRNSSRRLWLARGAWMVIALVVLGNLAVMTPGNALDANAMPVLTGGAALFTILCYPALKRILRVKA